MELVFQFLATCRDGVVHAGAAPFAMPLALLLAGLAGSAVHCAGMCGPFVLAQVMGDACDRPPGRYGEWQRLAGAALLPYHLGRATTYTLLGAIAGGATALFASLEAFGWLAGVLLLLAAALMIGQALGLALPAAAPFGGGLARLAGPLARASSPGARYLLGVVLGFLPCGLLYGALAAAGGTGSPLTGALAMAAFVAGTTPALVLVGWAGAFAQRRLRAIARWIAGPMLLASAALTAALAVQRF